MRNKTKYTKLILSFSEFGAGALESASSCQVAPGSPGLASAVDRNWTQEYTDWVTCSVCLSLQV